MVGVAAVVVVVVVVTAGSTVGSLPPPVPSTPFAIPLTTPVPHQPVTGFGFSAVDDPSTHQLVLFGGIDSYTTTWLWDGRRWTLARPAASPRGRFGASAAYDPITRMVMLYGGRLSPGDVVDDTWGWDGTTWLALDAGTGSPPVGEGSLMAWDPAHNQMVLSAGGQTWVWNGSHWDRQPDGDLPSGTAFGSVAFDPVTRALLAISCCAPQVTTYRWDGMAWRQVGSGANAPVILSLALDPVSDRLLLCTDPTQSQVGRQMWSWSGRDWIPLAGARLPLSPLAEVTDTVAGHLLILGTVPQPNQGSPQPLRVFSWTGSTWSQLG